MKVLHFQNMGVGTMLAAAQNKLGQDARVLTTLPHPFGFKEEYHLPRRSGLLHYDRWLLPRWDWRFYLDFDFLHSHSMSKLPGCVLRKYKGHFLQHYHDSMMRTPTYGNDTPSVVSLPSLLRIVPNATWIPLPCETEFFTPDRRIHHEGVRIGYSYQTTSNRKGFDPKKPQLIPVKEIGEAVAASKGRLTNYPLTSVLNHADMPMYYGEIDIWIDRIGVNFYGFAALEAASMGIPVITQIGDDEAQYVQGCPFISVKDAKDVKQVISDLSEDEGLRRQLGQKSRDFVKQTHDVMRSAQLCLGRYGDILNNAQ
jgi:hypothetical protein